MACPGAMAWRPVRWRASQAATWAYGALGTLRLMVSKPQRTALPATSSLERSVLQQLVSATLR